MAASLPGGLLERMLSLTETLLAALGQTHTTTASASSGLGLGFQDGTANSKFQDISCENGVKTKATIFTSLVPKSICNDQSHETPKQTETRRRSSSTSMNVAGISTTSTICYSGSPESTREQKIFRPGSGAQQVMVHVSRATLVSTIVLQ
jgi:hypothetical protein